MASLLLEDILNALEFFENHPVHATLAAAEACGFHQ
jgi:hypothetical protein